MVTFLWCFREVKKLFASGKLQCTFIRRTTAGVLPTTVIGKRLSFKISSDPDDAELFLFLFFSFFLTLLLFFTMHSYFMPTGCIVTGLQLTT